MTVQFGDIFGFFQGVFPVIARDEGFFQKRGLKVKFNNVASGPALATGIVNGDLDIAIEGLSVTWPLMQQGRPMKNLVGNIKNDFSILARPDVKLPSKGKPWPAPIRDLKGKTIGVTARGSQQEQFASAQLKAAGLSDKDVTYIAVGGPPTGAAAFKAKRIDAIVTVPPMSEVLGGREGQDFQTVADTLAGTAGNLFHDQLLNIYTASESFVREHADATLSFCKAMKDARDFAADPANLNRVADILAKWINVTPEQAKRVWQQNDKSFIPKLTSGLWSAQGQYAIGGATSVPNYDKYVYGPCQKL